MLFDYYLKTVYETCIVGRHAFTKFDQSIVPCKHPKVTDCSTKSGLKTKQGRTHIAFHVITLVYLEAPSTGFKYIGHAESTIIIRIH